MTSAGGDYRAASQGSLIALTGGKPTGKVEAIHQQSPEKETTPKLSDTVLNLCSLLGASSIVENFCNSMVAINAGQVCQGRESYLQNTPSMNVYIQSKHHCVMSPMILSLTVQSTYLHIISIAIFP